MKFVTVRDLRGKSGQVWKDLARERDIVLTSNGKPVAILSAVTERNLEESLVAHDPADAAGFSVPRRRPRHP